MIGEGYIQVRGSGSPRLVRLFALLAAASIQGGTCFANSLQVPGGASFIAGPEMSSILAVVMLFQTAVAVRAGSSRRPRP